MAAHRQGRGRAGGLVGTADQARDWPEQPGTGFPSAVNETVPPPSVGETVAVKVTVAP